MRPGPIVGVLLAAGSATRFGADKLSVALADGTPMGVASFTRLATAVDDVVVVVRPDHRSLALQLAERGARITVCSHAGDGMGVSLSWGVRAAPMAAGWVIALADMPWVRLETITAIVAALREGALIAAPTYQGARGNPVAFAAKLYDELIALSGDEGAKRVLARHQPALVATDDPGVMLDVDRPSDLAR